MELDSTDLMDNRVLTWEETKEDLADSDKEETDQESLSMDNRFKEETMDSDKEETLDSDSMETLDSDKEETLISDSMETLDSEDKSWEVKELSQE